MFLIGSKNFLFSEFIKPTIVSRATWKVEHLINGELIPFPSIKSSTVLSSSGFSFKSLTSLDNVFSENNISVNKGRFLEFVSIKVLNSLGFIISLLEMIESLKDS